MRVKLFIFLPLLAVAISAYGALARRLTSTEMPNPILRFECNENTGTAIGDSTGNGNNATFDGTWVAGKAGYALNFNGTSHDGVTDANLNCGSPVVTLMYWINPTAGALQASVLFEYGTNVTLSSHTFAASLHDSGFNKFVISGATGYKAVGVATNTFPNATWTHVAAVFNNSTASGEVTVYINGVLTATTTNTDTKTGTGNLTGNKLFICARSVWYRGALDDIMIFNRALNRDEIKYYMNRPR